MLPRAASRLPSAAALSSRPHPLQRRSQSLTHHQVFDPSLPDARPDQLQPPSSKPYRHPGLGIKKPAYNPLLQYEVPESEDDLRRAERRTPAAVFGMRKMPRISLPSELENKLERLVSQQDIQVTKRAWQLFLPDPEVRKRNPQALPPPKKSESTNLVPLNPAKRKQTSKQGQVLDLTLQPLKLMPRQTTKELVVTHAAAEVPTQYAILRSIMREVQSRNGWDTPETQGGIQIVDFAAQYGAAAWASVATLPSPPGRKNALILIEPNDMVSKFSQELLQLDTPGPLATWATLHFRSLHKFKAAKFAPRLRTEKSVGVLAFNLSTLRTPQERRRKLKEMWYSGVETIVVAEQGHRDGWTVVEEAREFLLGVGREELEAGLKDAGEWTPPAPPPAPESAAEEPSAEPAASSAPAPRLRGRRRPGERARAAAAATESEEGALAVAADVLVGNEVRLKSANGREKFMFNGVEFEEEDRRLEEEMKRDKEVASWTADGTALVKDGRVLGNHIVAPCPHDKKCPLASTPSPCVFNQLVEMPAITRLTKNVKADVSRLNFSYFIMRRGARPEITDEDRGEGRIGEVAREILQAQKEKDALVAVEGEDGMFGLPEAEETVGAEEGEGVEEVAKEKVDYDKLRKEIFEWGRVIRAPLPRKGHVEVDLCTPEGNIKRTTFSKRLGKQVWYDVSQIQDGDAFPHQSSIAHVRTRGIKELAPAHKTNKVSIKNGVVTGLDKLNYVEWKEVQEMMSSLGVEIPEYDSGRRPKNKKWVVEYSDEVEARDGWEAARKAERKISAQSKEEFIRGVLAGESQEPFDDAADASFEPPAAALRPSKLPLFSSNLSGSLADSEFEPTPLLGAQEVHYPRQSASDAFTSSRPSADFVPTGVLDGIIEGQADPEFSIASSTKISLAGLGPGWMEESSADVSAADRRVAAQDRAKTFAQMGIPVPNLGRPRTLQDDWALLEKWDGVAEHTPKPKRNAYWHRRDWRRPKPKK